MAKNDYISKAELKAAFEEDGHLTAYVEEMIDGCKTIDIERDLRDCRNELCLRCGDYKTKHLGSCDSCRWRDTA